MESGFAKKGHVWVFQQNGQSKTKGFYVDYKQKIEIPVVTFSFNNTFIYRIHFQQLANNFPACVTFFTRDGISVFFAPRTAGI